MAPGMSFIRFICLALLLSAIPLPLMSLDGLPVTGNTMPDAIPPLDLVHQLSQAHQALICEHENLVNEHAKLVEKHRSFLHQHRTLVEKQSSHVVAALRPTQTLLPIEDRPNSLTWSRSGSATTPRNTGRLSSELLRSADKIRKPRPRGRSNFKCRKCTYTTDRSFNLNKHLLKRNARLNHAPRNKNIL